ncbi:MAG: inositol monophosphatase family protein [Bacteroidia bacterium]
MDLEKLLQEVLRAVKETGKFIENERRTFSQSDVEAKDRNDLVSYVDKQSEKQLIEKLGKILPEAGFIAEESSPGTNSKELNWIIDPLDGTTNFIHNIPAYAVSVALAKGNELLIGVVYNIPQDELFYAHKNGKAFLNGKEISVSGNSVMGNCLIATGFPVKNFDRLDGFQNATEYFMKNTRGLRRMGAAAVDLCYVACGRFDGFFEYNLSPWDVAGGALIVKQAGGVVSDFKGGENYIFGKEAIASSANMYKEFHAVVSNSFLPKKP